MSETLVLLDGHALVHRAFHAVPPLSTASGELTNATFGFASMVFKALSDLKPEFIAVTFDRPTPTFRHVEYVEYKAQRPKMSDELRGQFGRVRELAEALSMPIYEIDGYEADDVLGTLARQAAEKGIQVVICTGDADALQLVAPRVRVMVPQRGFSETILYDEDTVKARYGLTPAQIPDFKALRGDPSDNIKGVPGIGEKTATKLLAEFGTVENLLDHVEDTAPKLKALLENNADEARLGKRLTTIVTDVPVSLDLEACRAGRYERPKLVRLLRELEFRSLMGKLPEERLAPIGPSVQPSLFGDETDVDVQPRFSPDSRPSGLGVYSVVDTEAALGDLIREIKKHDQVAVDTETTDVNAMRADLVGISLAVESGKAYYIPIGHTDGSSQLPLKLVAKKLGPVLADPKRGKIGHNLKYDKIILDRHGMPLEGAAFDTMVATYLLEPSQRALNLKDVAFTKLGVEMTQITELIGKGKSQISMAEVPVAQVADYASADADMTLRLMRNVEPDLKAAGLWSLFSDVEMPLVFVLAEMEQDGVALDVSYLGEMSRELGTRIADLETEIYNTAGHIFNVNSTKQLAQVLFDELRLPVSRRTKTGPSTDADTLEALRGAHPIVELILEHRQVIKLRSTYVDALPEMLNPETRRLHTSFNQTGAATGRLSSSDPNLQNIPIRTELGRRVRGAFVAGDPANLLLSADYSQIELRILAHVTEDENLLAAFAADEDIHAFTASQLFAVPIARVTSDQRRIAKTTNFGVLYGISDYGLSQQLGIGRRQAAEFIDNYFARYPTVRGYLDRTVRQAQEHGYVTTLLGRRRFIPDINVPNQAIRNGAERMAINTPIQGTAADIIKLAMIRIQKAIKSSGYRSRMILQVHDELLFECPSDEISEFRSVATGIMESALELKVRLKVDAKSGRNWRDME